MRAPRMSSTSTVGELSGGGFNRERWVHRTDTMICRIRVPPKGRIHWGKSKYGENVQWIRDVFLQWKATMSLKIKEPRIGFSESGQFLREKSSVSCTKQAIY